MNYLHSADIIIPVGYVKLNGHIDIPKNAKGMVIFTHGSGSGRNSPRNLKVAAYLHTHQLGTLLFDLLTPVEDINYYNRFDIDLLTTRLTGATEWLETLPVAKRLPVGYFGASTGAAAALNAAASLPYISAIVSRGGRPDLAMTSLPDVKAPVLLIVGSLDHDVLKLNREALEQMKCPKKLEVIPGATHLFQEEGKMEKVAELATSWFEKHLHPIAMNS